jgi:hypothetical protein
MIISPLERTDPARCLPTLAGDRIGSNPPVRLGIMQRPLSAQPRHPDASRRRTAYHPTAPFPDRTGKVSFGATLAVSRRLGHRQLRAESGRSPDRSRPARFDPQRSFRFWRRLRQFLDLPATALNPPSSTKLDVSRPRSIKIQFECELVHTSPSRIGFWYSCAVHP